MSFSKRERWRPPVGGEGGAPPMLGFFMLPFLPSPPPPPSLPPKLHGSTKPLGGVVGPPPGFSGSERLGGEEEWRERERERERER